VETNKTIYLGVTITIGEEDENPGSFWAAASDKSIFCNAYPSEEEAIEEVKEHLDTWGTEN
jgi:hypothetical protein